jgi:hypothetical protein
MKQYIVKSKETGNFIVLAIEPENEYLMEQFKEELSFTVTEIDQQGKEIK